MAASPPTRSARFWICISRSAEGRRIGELRGHRGKNQAGRSPAAFPAEREQGPRQVRRTAVRGGVAQASTAHMPPNWVGNPPGPSGKASTRAGRYGPQPPSSLAAIVQRTAARLHGGSGAAAPSSKQVTEKQRRSRTGGKIFEKEILFLEYTLLLRQFFGIIKCY